MVQLCSQTFGRPGDPAILLIAGVSSSMDWWEDGFCTALAGVVPDHEPAGHPSYGTRELLEDAVGLLDTYGVASACVMGISSGGAQAQLIALDHPGRVSALVLMSTFGPGLSGPPMDPALAAYFESAAEPDWSSVDAVIESQVGYARALAARSVPFDAAATRALVTRALGRTLDVRASLTNHALARDERQPWGAALGSLSVPTLVVHGTEDPMFPLGHGEALAAAIPGATLVRLPGVGHEFPPRAWPLVVPAVLEVSSRG